MLTMPSEPSDTGTRVTNDPPRKPRVWTVYVLFLLALLFTSIATVTLISWSFSRAHPGVTPSRLQLMEHALAPTTFSLTILLSALILSGSSLTAAALSRETLAKRLGLSAKGLRPLPVIVAMVGLPALSVVVENITLLLGVEISGTLEMIARSIGSARGPQRVLIVAAISLGPGIGEELLFRGYIQTRLLRRHGPIVAIFVTSLLFGLMHMDPLQSTLTVFLGGYLGFVAYRFGSLWPAVCAHALNNGVSAVALSVFPDEPAAAEPSFGALVVGAVVFLACLGYLLRALPRRAPDRD